jgi:hypothetical protein
MTMQIAIQARDGFVFASDTRIRTGADRAGHRAAPDSIINQSKIRISKRHNIAVGVSGLPNPDADPVQEFADYISGLAQLPDDFGEVIDTWTSAYQRKHGEGWALRLLVVNPSSENEPLWKVDVANVVKKAPGSGYWINGNETSSAIMWPEYCKCDSSPPDVRTATNIAALTILMGNELNPAGVAGLEIWTYTDSWRSADRVERSAIGERFTHLKDEISKFLHSAPNSSVTLQT